MTPSDDPMSLSLLYHLNSEPWRNDEAYSGAGYHQEFKEVESPVVRAGLPPATDSPLSRLIRSRLSCRAYSPRPMPLDAVSSLLAGAYGIVAAAGEDGSTFLRRSVPSAGGLFPLELFVFLQRVEGLSDGLYHYDVRGHALELLPGGRRTADLEPLLYPYPFVRDANVVVALAAVFGRNQKKYGPRGYRYTLLEAGHVAQNICLLGVELGLATLCMGGFEDSRLNKILGLDPATEGAVYAVAAGYPSP